MASPLPPPLSALERRLGIPVGDLADEDKSRAEAALEDATALALAEVSPAKATAWAANAPIVVLTVILKAARREFENPQGFRQEGLGEHSATVDTASGAFLTAAEVTIIRRAAGTDRFVGSIRTPSAYYDGQPLDTVYILTGPGMGDYLPLLATEDLTL